MKITTRRPFQDLEVAPPVIRLTGWDGQDAGLSEELERAKIRAYGADYVREALEMEGSDPRYAQALLEGPDPVERCMRFLGAARLKNAERAAPLTARAKLEKAFPGLSRLVPADQAVWDEVLAAFESGAIDAKTDLKGALKRLVEARKRNREATLADALKAAR